MALNVKIGSFAQPSSTGNQAVTGVGFKPKLVIFMMNQLTADGDTTNAKWGIGFGVSATDRYYMAGCAKNARTGSDSGDRQDNTRVIGCVTSVAGGAGFDPTTDCEADFVTMDNDGFTVNWTTVDATAREVVYWAFPESLTNYFGNHGPYVQVGSGMSRNELAT